MRPFSPMPSWPTASPPLVGGCVIPESARVTVPLNPESPEPERAAALARTGAARVIDDPADLPFGQPLDPVDVDPKTLAVLCETAGTSGPSRSAMLTHGSLGAALDQMGADA